MCAVWLDPNCGVLTGRLYRDPEDKTRGSFSIAEAIVASHTAKGRGEERELQLQLIPITFFGRQAEVLMEYAAKGTGITVQYEVRGRELNTKNNTPWYKAELTCREFTLQGTISQPEGRGKRVRGAMRTDGMDGWEGNDGGRAPGVGGVKQDDDIPF